MPERTELEPLPYNTIPQAICAAAAKYGEKPAIIDGARRVSYGVGCGVGRASGWRLHRAVEHALQGGRGGLYSGPQPGAVSGGDGEIPGRVLQGQAGWSGFAGSGADCGAAIRRGTGHYGMAGILAGQHTGAGGGDRRRDRGRDGRGNFRHHVYLGNHRLSQGRRDEPCAEYPHLYSVGAVDEPGAGGPVPDHLPVLPLLRLQSRLAVPFHRRGDSLSTAGAGR